MMEVNIMANEIFLNCELNKNCYLATDQTQLAYLLIEAKPANGNFTSKMPLNLCFVMDRSASMKGEKIENVKTAIIRIIDRLSAEDYLSVVIFNEEAEVLVPSQLVSDKGNLREQVTQLSHSGGTAMSTGIKEGLNQIRQNLSPDRINRMIILTDGQTYGDEEDCYRLATEAAQDGVSITTLGVGDEWHEEVIDTIAEKNAGKSDYIENPDDIIPIFDSEMNTLEDIITQNKRNLIIIRKIFS